MAKSVSAENTVDKVIFGAVFVLLSIATLIVTFGLFTEPTSTVADRIIAMVIGGFLTWMLCHMWLVRPKG